MRYRILGPLEVADEDGRRIEPGPTDRQLLLVLLLHAGEVVSTDRLADAMWGDDLPTNPRNALQARVSRLRKLLGDDAIATHDPGYVLQTDPDAVDAHRFEQLLTAGRGADDPHQRRLLLDTALALWRGPALDDVAYEDFAVAEAERLDALRIDAIEVRIDAALDLGEHASVVSELEALTAEHPLREGLYRRLMLALYRAGRQADALAVYHDARRRLDEDLGVEPGPDLVALEAAVLRHDPSLTPPTDRSGLAFPTPLTSFVGRTDELADVAAALQRSRLVTLVGSGGVGKTRLAIEAVGSADGERGFVNLDAVVPGGVIAEVGTALRLDRGPPALGAPPATANLDELIVADLRDRNALLIIDNCEHVIDEAAGVIETLLTRIGDLRVLATSRERLGVPGEVVLPVPPLPTTSDRGSGVLASQAETLFTTRAQDVNPQFDPTGAADAIVDICVRLDGIPLAIELAAARTRSLPPAAIAERLDDRFRLLTGTRRTAATRQRTLRAAIDWSYQLLAPTERRVLQRLAVLPGSFNLTAAVTVAGDDDVGPDDVVDAIDRLVDQSMLVPVARPHSRYRLLETIRAYARGQLAGTADADATARRMIDHYADVVDTADAQLRTGEQAQWLARLTDDHDNVTTALDRAWSVDPDTAVRLTGRLAWFWYLRGMFDDADRWLQRAVELPTGGREHAMAEVHFAAALLSQHSPASPEGRAFLASALELARAAGNAAVEARALTITGAFEMAADRDAGLATITTARGIFERDGDEWGVGLTGYVAAVASHDDVHAAQRHADAARDAFARTGDPWGIASAEQALGACQRALGDHDAALQTLTSALTHARRLSSFHEATVRTELATVSVLRGDYDTAARHLDAVGDLGQRYPTSVATAAAADAAGFLARRTGRLDEAIAHHTTALVINREWQTPHGIAHSLACLGLAEAQAGRLDDAATHHGESLTLARQLGDDRAAAFALEGLAGVAAARHDPTQAATLLGAAHRLRSERGVPLPPGADLDVTRVRDTTVGLSDHTRFDAAFTAGGDMPADDLDRYVADMA